MAAAADGWIPAARCRRYRAASVSNRRPLRPRHALQARKINIIRQERHETASCERGALVRAAGVPSAAAIVPVLGPAISLATLLFIVRIVMTWYPEIDGTTLPWSIAYTPTEPFLSPTRRVIPKLNGVDVSPIVWTALLSFANETLLGPQGVLIILAKKAAAVE